MLLLTDVGVRGASDSEVEDVAPLATDMLSRAICAVAGRDLDEDRHEPYQLDRAGALDEAVGFDCPGSTLVCSDCDGV